MDFMGFRAFENQVSTTSYHHPPNVGYDPTFSAAELFRNPSSSSNGNERAPSLLREIEKEKIRRDIIGAEIFRKRVLQEEEESRRTRRVLMAAFRGPHEGFCLSSSVLESRAIEERLALSFEERMGDRNRFETVPFQRFPEPRVSEIRPSLEAIPAQNFVKRKAVTLLEAGASDIHSVDLKKKPKEEWSCSICQVSAPSEYSLNQHFQGKKHKAKEAFGQRAGGTGNNYAIGFCPKI